MEKDRALLIVDMLNDFVLDHAPLRVHGIESIIKPIQREINKAHTLGHKVIYICDSHDRQDGEFKLYPPHAVSGSKGSEIIDSLKPQYNKDIVISKSTLSGFYRTELGDILTKLGIKELIITGCVVNICVFLIAAEAVARGYRVNVVKDAVIGFSTEDYNYSLEQLEKFFKVNLI